jgi:hypothetical protein
LSTNLELEADEACASFGIAAVDDVKLKYVIMTVISCIIAAMVARKIKRSRSLFTQPDSSYLEECPICILPLSLDASKSIMMECCCKVICNGCNYANMMREIEEELEPRCLFCRNHAPKTQEESDKLLMKRIKKNDPVAMVFGKAVEYWTNARCCLGTLYYGGNGVEKDMKKAMHHLELAAIGGHPQARGLLAVQEMKNGRFNKATKHLIIAANLGCDDSLEAITDLFLQGIVSEEQCTAAHRGHHAAVNETKSAEREKVDAYFKRHERRRS